MNKLKLTIQLFSAMVLTLGLFAVETNAAIFTVSNTSDTGAGSLRQAIISANANADDDQIVFDPVVFATAQTITLLSEIAVADNGSLTIQGTGAKNLTISGNDTNRIFNVSAAIFTLSGATLTGGFVSSGFLGGGAIVVSGGTTVLQAVVFRQNRCTNCDFIAGGNGGGGVYFVGGTNHRIENSTSDRNSADGSALGGGGFLASDNASVTVTNSTFSGNTANNSGGGGGGFAYNSATVTVRNTTIVGNSGRFGGGIFAANGSSSIGNCIVAGNTHSGAGSDLYDFGGLVSSGYNLIGSNQQVEEKFPAGTPNANNDIVGTSASPIDPLLGALSDNGGATPTFALLSNSPAIDKGSSFGATSDQRGLLRPVDNPLIANAADGADIGAFEVQLAPTAAAVSVSGRVTTSNGRGIGNVTILMTDAGGNERTAVTTSFGYYRFNDVTVGETVIIRAKAKRFSFNQSSIVRTTIDQISDADFVAVD